MKFEDVKAAFQKRNFEGYLFENPPAVVAEEVRREVEKRLQKFDRRQFADCGIMMILVFLFLILVILQSSLMARSGASLVTLTLVLEGFSAIRMARMERRMRFDQPPRESLLEEKKLVVAQIREARFQSTLYLVPTILGGVLLCLARAESQQTLLGFVTGSLSGLLLFYFLQASRIRKRVHPRLDRINRELAELDAKPS